MNNFKPTRQRGAVLITGVIFLVVVTMIVLAVLRSGTLEEKMARNSRDAQVALQAAESVLREAEATFSGPPFDPYDPSAFTSACTNGYCFKPAAGATWQTIDWTSTTLTRTFAAATSHIGGLNSQPRYIVEIIVPPVKGSSVGQCENGIAKVTARGVGNGNAASYVQSTVRFKVFTNICDF
ncbi:MAG: PilX N-terminal domain-containing pilus assembly protein [Pseudomonadota bacterium]